jgi:hypothetical protein
MTDHQAALAEANRIRIETMRERYPGWEESFAETAAYLASLGKDPEEYVRAWSIFRPRIAQLRRNHPAFGRAHGGARLQPRGSDAVFDDWRLAHAAFRLAG